MENNQPVQTQQQQQPATPVASTQAAVPPVAPVSNEDSGESKKMVLFLIAGVIFIIVLVGGVYMYLSKIQEAPDTAKISTPQQTSEQPEISKPDAIEQEINSINATSIDESMSGVDQDIKGL